MKIDRYDFGRVTIDGVENEHDVVINSGLPKRTKVILHVTC